MTCKELFQALLDGRHVKNEYWDNQHYLYMDKNGNLIEHFYGEKKVVNLGCIDLRNDWITSMDSILEDDEKETINNIIYFCRNKIKYVFKMKLDDDYECIKIVPIEDLGYNTYSPIFPKNTKFIGMDLNKKYLLNELGL